MERTPAGTSVGVDDPYAHVERCDHLTDDGRCRFAVERAASDPQFARERRLDGFRCPVVNTDSNPHQDLDSDVSRDPDTAPVPHQDLDAVSDPDQHPGPERDWDWQDCPHFRSRASAGDRECARCGLAERRLAHTDERPLLEEHHLSYAGEEATSHVVTVFLCRWCHARVHRSWARIDDDAAPAPEAIAHREERRAREHEECAFESAADRYREE